jgi:dynein light intermediate chain 1
VEAHLRHYVEPASTTAAAPGPSSAPQVDTDTPLPLGVLTDNLGLGLVIVCTKVRPPCDSRYPRLTLFLQADHINLLERERDFKEEQFDYIQQALRTIALKCELTRRIPLLTANESHPDGAGLFFTSHTQPASFIKLRAYLLRRLFSPSSPAAAQGVRPFPFPHRANVVDRDQVLVPTGWDSWGKIRVLRDRFDADAVGKGWELDMETERDRLAGRPASQEEQLDVEGRRVVGALRMYEEMVTDLDSENLVSETSRGCSPDPDSLIRSR